MEIHNNNLMCSGSGQSIDLVIPTADDQLAGVVGELGKLLERVDNEAAQKIVHDFRPDDPMDTCSRLIIGVDASIGAMKQRLGQAESLNHELRLQLKARASESHTDGLTGLANRRLFDREFGERCMAAQQSCCPLVLVILDIDHFKAINDSFGHHVGDAVLRGIAKLFKNSLPSGTFLARYGGEEFGCILSGASLDNAIDIVERVRGIVCGTEFRYEGRSLGLTISSGIAQLVPQDHCDRLLQRADAAMYAAKQAGRNRTFWSNGERLHCVTNDEPLATDDTASGTRNRCSNVVELNSCLKTSASPRDEMPFQSASALNLRTTRANWCDGTMLFWNIRQRLAEWKAGGDPFCILAVEVDDGPQIASSYGTVALHFMMRVQLLHLDANLRDLDIIARTGSTRIIVLLPRSTLALIDPILKRLRESMHRFAFPTPTELVEYSISIGVTEVADQDDAQLLVQRAELALASAQSHGKAQFFAQDSNHAWPLEL